MMNFTQALQLLARCIHDSHRIDRVQIDRNHKLGFSINGTTWYQTEDNTLKRCYALDDPDIPLARWASTQAARRLLVVAYRPGKRLVIQDLEQGKIVKGYPEGKSSKAAKRHQIAERILDGVAQVSAPALVSHNRALDSIEIEYLRARPLRITRAPVVELERVGSTLAKMQYANNNAKTGDLKHWTIADELYVLSQWSTKLQTVGLGLPERWHAAVDFLASHTPVEEELMVAHRDLHDGQWLSSPASLWLLDFDTLCVSHPMLDLGNFAAHIDLRYEQWKKCDPIARASSLQHLLGGYRCSSVVDQHSLCWFHAASLLRLALVYSIRPRWSHVSKPLVARANSLLHEQFGLER